MKEEAISVTDAARNFSDCVNRAFYQGVTFVLLRNGQPVASITPETRCTAGDLAKLLKKNRLTQKEAQAWLDDMKAGREKLISPKDGWE